LYPRTFALAAFALGIAACATSVDDTDGSDPDSGGVVDTDGSADGGSDATYGGHDSSLADGASNADSANTADGFPPPGDASAHLDSAASPDSASHDASSADTGSTGPCAFTGAIATFTLTSQAGDEASASVSSSATGVTVAPLTRSTGLTPVSGAGSINSSGWPTTTPADPGKYYTFTVTPPTGCTLTLTTLALDVKASGAGPATGDVATSADAFAEHTTSFAGTSTPNVTLSGATGTSPIEIRVYGYGATSAAGTFRILGTLTLSGSTS